jgi:hypothetical protein
MPGPTIFGREPAVWIGLLEACLAVILTLHTGLSQDMASGIMAVVVALAGLYTAYVTKQTMLGVLVGLTKAFFILFAAFSFHVSDPTQAAIISLVTIIGGFTNQGRATVLPPEQHSLDLAA